MDSPVSFQCWENRPRNALPDNQIPLVLCSRVYSFFLFQGGSSDPDSLPDSDSCDISGDEEAALLRSACASGSGALRLLFRFLSIRLRLYLRRFGLLIFENLIGLDHRPPPLLSAEPRLGILCRGVAFANAQEEPQSSPGLRWPAGRPIVGAGPYSLRPTCLIPTPSNRRRRVAYFGGNTVLASGRPRRRETASRAGR